MNIFIRKITFFSPFIALAICLISSCLAMDEMRAPKNKTPITTVTNESRLLLDSAGPRYWSIISPKIRIEGRIDPTKRDYKCHHFALQTTLGLPEHLRFSAKEPRTPIVFVNKYFEPTHNPKVADLVEYLAKDPNGYHYVSHFAIFNTKSHYLSKWGEFPQIISHAPRSCPALYGDLVRFKTLKPEYKDDKKALFADIEKKKAKSFLRLEHTDHILSGYEEPRTSLNMEKLKTNEEYLSFLHDYNTTLDRLHEYPLSQDELVKIAQF